MKSGGKTQHAGVEIGAQFRALWQLRHLSPGSPAPTMHSQRFPANHALPRRLQYGPARPGGLFLSSFLHVPSDSNLRRRRQPQAGLNTRYRSLNGRVWHLPGPRG